MVVAREPVVFLFFGAVLILAPPHSFCLLPPEQVHIALGETSSEMSVSWVTQIGSDDPEVQYGLTQNQLNMTSYGYSKILHDQGEAKRNFTINVGVMTGLSPRQRYYYRVGDNISGWSNTFTFQAAQPSGSSDPYWMIIFGDMGTTNAQILTPVQNEVSNGTASYVLHIGDFAYDMYEEDGKVGDTFMRMIEPVASSVPYMVCLGNHESHYNFLHYTMRFINQPSNSGFLPSIAGSEVAGLPNNWFFSYDIGLIHFIAFSTEIYFDYPQLIPVQWKWLQTDLEQVNQRRNITPWVVLYGHRSVYCSCDGDCGADATLVREGPNKKYGIEELAYKYGVDLFINGHEHDYERNYAIYNFTYMGGNDSMVVNPNATVYIVTGAAGSREGHEPFRLPKPVYSAVRFDTYGYSKMMPVNSTHLYWKQIQTDSGEVGACLFFCYGYNGE
jgi:hypothetical protein